MRNAAPPPPPAAPLPLPPTPLDANSAAAAAAAVAAHTPRESERYAGLSEMERWTVELVNAEFRRSQQGRWRRLFPSERSAEYLPFLDPSHRMHHLPFDV